MATVAQVHSEVVVLVSTVAIVWEPLALASPAAVARNVELVEPTADSDHRS